MSQNADIRSMKRHELKLEIKRLETKIQNGTANGFDVQAYRDAVDLYQAHIETKDAVQREKDHQAKTP